VTSVLRAVSAVADGEEGGGLTVSWTIEGDDIAVAVAVGPEPGSIDPATAITADPASRSIRLQRLPPGRPYVAVAPAGGGPALLAATRRVGFAGALNFRDLGGLPTSDGRNTRWGLVFRADALSGLTADDQVLFSRMGIKTVIDLRGDEERERQPNPPWQGEVTTRTVPLIGSQSRSYREVAGGNSDGEQFLFDLYRHMASDSAPLLGEILTELSDPASLPAVFHCAGGKDRTGITAALLLLVLGVAHEDVLDDYALTSSYLLPDRIEELVRRLASEGVSPEAAAGLFGTPRWAMERALAEVTDRHGSVREYLTGPAGMATGALDALRQNLVA
jgi:protein-tyrosine phosphatase